MRGTRVVAVVVAVLMAGSVFAYPAIGGGRGLFRVQNALVESEAGLTISLDAIGRNPKCPKSDEHKFWTADLVAPSLSYAPLVTDFVGLELFGSWGGVFQDTKTPCGTGSDEGGFAMGLHDLKAGGKLSIPIIPVLKLGVGGSYTFKSDRNERTWLDQMALPQAIDPKYTWTGMANLQFNELASAAPNLLLNYGKVNDYTVYAAGIELVAEGFALFAEARSMQQSSDFGSIIDMEKGELRITPGLAFGTGTSDVTFKAGYTFSFGPDSAYGTPAPNEAMLGLVIATPFGRRTPPEFGSIAGSVVDDRNGKPLAAKVNFPENPGMMSLSTDPRTGVFSIGDVSTGVIVVEVGAEGYHSQAMPLNVEANAVSQYQFRLKPLVTYGVIAGVVTDAVENKPLEATVEFPGTDLASVTSDPGTGAFRVDNVPVGVYTLTAQADGYFKASQTVQVGEGQVATPAFSLKPLAMQSTMTGKVSDKKTGEPLAAVISFPNSDVPQVKNDPATGVYKTDLPVGSYAVKVSSEGYLDQTAAVVLQEGKPLVRDFELVKEGMAITLRGIYFDVNKATIKPESNPALEDAAKILKENPDIRVEIQGHTDSDGSESYNLQLSERRAQSVVTYLVQNFGIAMGRLTARGYGESQPVASNSTPEGKQLNRRVEFVILKSGQ